MADVSDIGKPETSEDDSISLTSSMSEESQDRDYPVKCILAEWETNGIMSYLTWFEGYPQEVSIWLFREAFGPTEENGEDVFSEWQRTKMRIDRGYEKAFDIDDFEKRKAEFERQRMARRDRRRKKRARFDRIAVRMCSANENQPYKGTVKHEMKPRVSSSSISVSEEESVKDAELLKEENSSSRASQKVWTSGEEQAFVQGLKLADGPNFKRILAKYGPRGTTNRILKNRNLEDMREHLQKMKRDFEAAGRDPPTYMIAPSISSDESSLEALRSRRRRRKSKILEETESNYSNLSVDSMMEELASKTAKKDILHPQSWGERPQRPRSDSKIDISQPKKPPSTKGVQNRRLSHRQSPEQHKNPSDSMQINSDHKTKDAQKPGLKRPFNAPENILDNETSPSVPGKQATGSTNPTQRAYAGTARLPPDIPLRRFSKSVVSRAAIPGKRPAPLSAFQQKRNGNAISTKLRKLGGIDVTANLGGKHKIRKARTLPTINAVPDGAPPLKTFKSLSVRNKIHKWRQTEPPPDPAKLVFLDPKTGKAKQTLASPRNAEPNLTDLQQKSYPKSDQEDAGAIEAEPSCPREIEPYLNNIDSSESLFVDNGDPRHLDNDVTDDSGLVQESPRFSAPAATAQLLRSQSDSILPLPDNLINPLKGTKDSHPRLNTRDTISTRPTNHRHISDPASILPSSATSSSSDQFLRQTEITQITLMAHSTQKDRDELLRKYEPTLVIGIFRIGPDLKIFSKVRLAGFTRDVQQLLLSIRLSTELPHYDFRKICSAPEYWRYMHNDCKYLGSGYITPYGELDRELESIPELLACHVSAGICFTRRFTMIIWPAGASSWAFLEQKFANVPAGVTLRFLLREPLLECDDARPPIDTHSLSHEPDYYRKLKANISNTPIQPGEKNINVVFRDLFEIDFDRLVAQQLPAKNFFLCFVPAGCENYEPDELKRQALRIKTSEEHDLFVHFLEENGAENILSMQDFGSDDVVNNASWNYFIRNYTCGTIIVHDRFGRIDQLPWLAKLLRNNTISVWMTSLSPMDLEVETHPHLVRLFPQGGVLLVTVSLILYRPDDALRLLRWFRLCHLPSKAWGTWKVAVRPRCLTWLTELQDLCCDETLQSPFGYHGQVHADIYSEIYILLNRNEEPFGLMMEDWDTEVPEPDAPVVATSDLPRGRKEWNGDTFETAKVNHDAIRWNDEELIHWFSQWAGIHLDDHRKFFVLLGYPLGDEKGEYVIKCYEKGYGYLDHGPDKPGRQERGLFIRSDGVNMKHACERNFLEIMSIEKYFTVCEKVLDAQTLAKMARDRGKKDRENALRLEEEIKVEQREARLAAKNTLESIMQRCRDYGGTEEAARARGRRHLIWQRDELGIATDKEVRECQIDMEWQGPAIYQRMRKLLEGTEEEKAQAYKEGEEELEREMETEKEERSGDEMRRAWDEEVRMWAERDRLGGDAVIAGGRDVDEGDGRMSGVVKENGGDV